MDNTESEYTILPLDHLLHTPSTSVEGASLFENHDKEKIKEALYQLAVPLVEIDFSRNNFNRLFPRSRAVQTVVVGIEDFNVAISTHPRDINTIINKIKTPDQLLFVATSVGRIIRQHTQEGHTVNQELN